MSRPGVSSRLLAIGGALVALAVPPLLLRAEPENWDAIRGEVEALPQADRDRLNRNTSDYLQLSDADRQRYRDLHAKLADDAHNGRGRLRETLNVYTAWLASNHAYDRQQLLMTTDPQRRVAEMQRIVEERNEAMNRSRGWRSRGWMWFRGVPDLTAEELVPVMDVVENGLALNPDDRQKLVDKDGNEKEGVARYFALFGILRDRNGDLGAVLDRHVNALLEQVPEAKRPADLDEMPVDNRRFICVAMIVGNVLQEFEQEFRRRPPTDAELQRMVDEWPAENQRELDSLLERDPSDFRRQLENKYARDTYALDVDEVRDVVPREFRFGRGRRGPSDRPEAGPDGERGPRRFFRGAPDGDRPFPERPGSLVPRNPPEGPDGRRPEPGREFDGPRGPRPGEDPPPPNGDRPPQPQ